VHVVVAGSIQSQMEESLENVQNLLAEVNRDLDATTKNYEIAVKKGEEA
jgi:hypothetical protein